MIDTHCHLGFPDFAADGPVGGIAAVLERCRGHGVTGVITISTTVPDAARNLAIAKAHDRVWCSAGVHPLYADEGPHEWAWLRAVVEDEKCVAWGELGLDNHYKEPAAADQRRVLDEQLAFIKSVDAEMIGRGARPKPIVLHCREAFDDLIPVLRNAGLPGDRFVFHCFTGGPVEARQCLDFGAMLSFTGVVTYRNAREVKEAAVLTPADRIMVETDAPYLSPEPNRGKRPCEPWMSSLTAKFLAEARGEPWGRFHEAINANTERFFGVPAR